MTRNGKIIDEKTYRLNMAKKEHRKHVRDLLGTAIVHKTLDMEVCINLNINFISLIINIRKQPAIIDLSVSLFSWVC